ncbi:MAG: hypothetical protein ACE5G8_01680 [Anaerolineae bacterium]
MSQSQTSSNEQDHPMPPVTLTDAQTRSRFFRQTVLTNLRYWQGWLQDRPADVPTLDRERDGVLRAILSPYMERRGHWGSWRQILEQTVETGPPRRR